MEVKKKPIASIVQWQQIPARVVGVGKCVCGAAYRIDHPKAINELQAGRILEATCDQCKALLAVQKPLIVDARGAAFVRK